MNKLTEIDELRIEQLAKHFFESNHGLQTATTQLKLLIVRLLEKERAYNERNNYRPAVRVSQILEETNETND